MQAAASMPAARIFPEKENPYHRRQRHQKGRAKND
jgi:hypothetical protein